MDLRWIAAAAAATVLVIHSMIRYKSDNKRKLINCTTAADAIPEPATSEQHQQESEVPEPATAEHQHGSEQQHQHQQAPGLLDLPAEILTRTLVPLAARALAVATMTAPALRDLHCLDGLWLEQCRRCVRCH